LIRELLRRSLTARLSGAFLALSLATLAMATYVSYRSAEDTLRDRLLDRLATFAAEDASELTSWLDRHRETVRFLASLGVSRRAAARDTTGLGLIVRGIDRSIFAATEVEVLQVPGGRVLFSTEPTRIGAFGVAQLYYLQGRVGDFTQPIYPGARDGHPTLTVSTPIRDTAGVVRAVLAAHLDLQQMEAAIRKSDADVPVDAYLISQFAEFVSAERFGRPGTRRGVHSVAIDSALKGTNGAGLYTDYAGRAVIGAWRWLPDHQLGLILEAPQDRAFAPARELLVRSFLVGLLAAIVLSLAVVAVTRRLTAPLLTMATAAERLAAGDFGAAAPVTGRDEVGALATAFNTMTARLRTVYGELGDQVLATQQALTEAQTSRALLQDVVDNTTTIVLVVGADRRVRLANARLGQALGVSAAELIGRPLDDLDGNFGRALAELVDDAGRADGATGREVELGEDGILHTWQCVAFPLRDAGGARYAMGLVATDLTERARLEEDRRARDASVQQAQKLESLGIMAGGIAHDFNNLLGTILGNVDLAEHSLDHPAEVREALEQISAAARRASELSRQMLAYAGRASLRRETLDARRVVHDIVPLVRASQPKRVEFVVDGLDDALWVEADPAQLSQVVLNLLSNAAEAIGDAPGRVTVTAGLHEQLPPLEHEEHPTHRGPWVRLSVADTGAGMSPEVQARIFDPFFTTKASGRGLGLSAVRGIIRSTGGVLRLTSTPGVGTRFDLYLPEAAPPQQELEPPSTTPTGRRRATVLVVDDEESLRRVTRRTLELAGMNVVEAADGDAGLERFKEYEPVLALVILDITMPGLNGIELLAEIRKIRPTIPAIIASGYDRSDELASAAPDRNTRFLQKPFEIATLREMAAELLARRR
jgi:PAS domain S-box-containing protein